MRNRYFTFSVCIFVILLLCGCSKTSNSNISNDTVSSMAPTSEPTTTLSPYPDQVIIANGNISFSRIYDDLFLVDGEFQENVCLKYNYSPRDVNIAVEEWTSSNEDIAIVDGKGVVTPVGIGTCDINLHVSDGLSEGAYTSITISVEEGTVQFEESNFPTYSEIFDYFENLDNGRNFILDYGEGLDFVDTGFYYYTDLVSVFCGSTGSTKYQGADLKDSVWYERLKKMDYCIGQMDGMTMVISSDNDEYFSVTVLSDEYSVSFGDSSGDFTEVVRIMNELGYPDLTKYFDLDAL